jgi:multidrug efflux pump subunit AcrB
MAIDMIEQNELGALAPSRVGNDRCFVDEKSRSYLGFTGEEDFYNLFGSQKRKASVAQVEKDARAKWASYDTKTCGGIDLLLQDAMVERERITKQMAQGGGFELPVQMKIVVEAESNAKRLRNQYDCVKKAAEEEKEKNRTSFLNTLRTESDTAVDKAKNDLLGLDMGKDEKNEGGINKNLLLYGGIGLGALVVIALIFRK